MIGLTPRQRELWRYLNTRKAPPRHKDMQRALRTGSGRIDELLSALEERGYIRRRSNQHPCFDFATPPVVIRGQFYRFIALERVET